MSRIAATLFVIYALLTVSITSPVLAQPQARPNDNVVAGTAGKVPPTTPASTADETAAGKREIDFKKVFDEETKKFNASSAEFDPVKIDFEKAKQAQKRRWTKRDTALMVLFAVGITVLVVLVAKYSKKCVETSTPNCTPAVDEGCYCERYEEDDNNRGITIR